MFYDDNPIALLGEFVGDQSLASAGKDAVTKVSSPQDFVKVDIGHIEVLEDILSIPASLYSTGGVDGELQAKTAPVVNASSAQLPLQQRPQRSSSSSVLSPHSPVKVSFEAETLRLDDFRGNDYLLSCERQPPPAPSPPYVPSPGSAGSAASASLSDFSSPNTPLSLPSVSQTPSPAPSSAVTSVIPSVPATKIKSRSARKRQQNKDAAVRYRLRKQSEQKKLSNLCEELREENSELKRKQTRLINEIAYVKGLLEEVMNARERRAAEQAGKKKEQLV